MKLNSKRIKQFFRDTFDKKMMMKKGIIAACAAALVLIFSLSFYFWLKDKNVGYTINENGFWYIQIARNPGIAWSSLANKPGAIFAIQSVVSIVMIIIFLFVCKNITTSVFIALAIFGGLFNLFQRASVTDKMVLDYFVFGFWKSFPTFNWPDMFVVIGIFGFLISYIVYLIREEDKEFEQKQQEGVTKPEQPQTTIPSQSDVTPTSVQQ